MDGPWTKLGVIGTPTGRPPTWTNAWNSRRLDSGRALIIGGKKGYWTKGVAGPKGRDVSIAQEGVYFPNDNARFKPPWKEWSGNPLYRAPSNHADGYENCEFFMGPKPVSQPQIVNQDGATSGFEMCFARSTLGAGSHRSQRSQPNTPRIQNRE